MATMDNIAARIAEVGFDGLTDAEKAQLVSDANQTASAREKGKAYRQSEAGKATAKRQREKMTARNQFARAVLDMMLEDPSKAHSYNAISNRLAREGITNPDAVDG